CGPSIAGACRETRATQQARLAGCALICRRQNWSSSLLKKVFEVSLWATLIQDPSARRTKDSQPSGFGFEYCASHVRFRVFQQTAREETTMNRAILGATLAGALVLVTSICWTQSWAQDQGRPPAPPALVGMGLRRFHPSRLECPSKSSTASM